MIEAEIQKALDGMVGVENIMVKTTSTQSQDVFKALDQKPTSAQKTPANTQPPKLRQVTERLEIKSQFLELEKLLLLGLVKVG